MYSLPREWWVNGEGVKFGPVKGGCSPPQDCRGGGGQVWGVEGEGTGTKHGEWCIHRKGILNADSKSYGRVMMRGPSSEVTLTPDLHTQTV